MALKRLFTECIFGWSLNEKERALYKILYIKGNRITAEKMCTELGGVLAEVENTDENAFIYSLLDANLEIYKDAEYWIANLANETQFKDYRTNEREVNNCVAVMREAEMWKWKRVPCASNWKR